MALCFVDPADAIRAIADSIGREARRQLLVELGVGDLVDPGADRLAEQLATGLTADRVGDRADRVGGVYEAESHMRINLETP